MSDLVDKASLERARRRRRRQARRRVLCVVADADVGADGADGVVKDHHREYDEAAADDADRHGDDGGGVCDEDDEGDDRGDCRQRTGLGPSCL